MKKIIFLSAITFLLFCSSCNKDSDDRESRITDFGVPELTETNSIQLTVNIKANDYAHFLLQGGKIAVDWGDGNITKDRNPEKGQSWRTEFTHVYKKSGEYKLKIWSEELTFISISALDKDYKQFKIAACPVLEYAMLNSFSGEKTLNLNDCPKLKMLNLGNWRQLESVALDKCSELKEIQSYTNPVLKILDVSKNSKLESLYCTESGIEQLKLPSDIINVNCWKNNIKSLSIKDFKALTTLDCSNNKDLDSLNLSGCTNLTALSFDSTKVDAFDFSVFSNLMLISCTNTKMTGVDVSKNKNLRSLNCAKLGLVSLDVINNQNLVVLDCADNKLSALDVSTNNYFRELYINGNLFEKDALETIFKTLPKFNPTAKSNMPPPKPSIKIYDNPGASASSIKIITDKGWVVKGK